MEIVFCLQEREWVGSCLYKGEDRWVIGRKLPKACVVWVEGWGIGLKISGGML